MCHKQKRIKAALISLSLLAVLLLSACELSPKLFSIKLKAEFPVCYAGEPYDLMQTVDVNSVAEYLFAAHYESETGAAVAVTGTSITPEKAGAYFIKVTGLLGTKSDAATFTLTAVARNAGEPEEEPPAKPGVYELNRAAVPSDEGMALVSLTLGNIKATKPEGGTRPSLLRSNALDEITVTLPSKQEAAEDYGNQSFVTGEVSFPLTLADSVNIEDAIFAVSLKETNAMLTGITLADKAGLRSKTLSVRLPAPQGSDYMVIDDSDNIGYTALVVMLDQFHQTRQGASGANFSAFNANSLILTFSNEGSAAGLGTVRVKIPSLFDYALNPLLEHADLSGHPSITSVKTDHWGNASALTAESPGLGYSSKKTLVASLNGVSQMPEVYAGNEIWSWIKIPVAEIYGGNVDLSDKCLSWMMDIALAQANTSVILVDKNGVYSEERGIDFSDHTVVPHRAQAYTAYANARLEEDFLYNLFFDFSAYGGTTFSQRSYPHGTRFDVTACKEILITVSNAGLEHAAVRFDYMFLLDGVPDGVVFQQTPVARTYSLSDSSPENIDVLFIGNSFIYSSEVGKSLQSLSDENGRNLRVESYSLGSAVGSTLFAEALGGFANSYTTSWGHKLFNGGYDYLVIQANFWGNINEGYFNRVEDFAYMLSGFDTQIVLMPAYNEGGEINAGYPVIDWRGLDWALLQDSTYDYTRLLQYGADKWHANVLSGYGAALLSYEFFFNDVPPATRQTEAMIKEGWVVNGTSIGQYEYDELRYLPDEEAQAIFHQIRMCAFG